MRTNHLAAKQLLVEIVEIAVVCMKTGRVFGIHCWLSVWTEPGQCQYWIPLLRKPIRTDLLLCDRWQTSAQACTASKKWHKQEEKKH